MMRDIRQRDEGAIIRWRQHVIVHRTESLTSGTTEVEQSDGLRRIGQKLSQQPQTIQHLLAVGLDDFASQAAGWPSSLFQNQSADPYLRKGQAEHGASPARPHDHNLCSFHRLCVHSPFAGYRQAA
jgi:hypothetical protein